MTEQSLIPFFDPKGVAVIGVSRDPTKLGYGLARNLEGDLAGFDLIDPCGIPGLRVTSLVEAAGREIPAL